jgi:hypothetical protein
MSPISNFPLDPAIFQRAEEVEPLCGIICVVGLTSGHLAGIGWQGMMGAGDATTAAAAAATPGWWFYSGELQAETPQGSAAAARAAHAAAARAARAAEAAEGAEWAVAVEEIPPRGAEEFNGPAVPSGKTKLYRPHHKPVGSGWRGLIYVIL